MDNIIKNINLECAKNRFCGNFMPALDSGTLNEMNGTDCWGAFPYDVIIESGDTFGIFELREHLPMLCECNQYVFRFGNISKIYGWLRYRIAIETFFYKLVKRQGKYKWIEVELDFWDSGTTVNMLSMVPNIEDYIETSGNVCEIIAVHEDADTFNKCFRLDGDDTRYELNFRDFILSLFSGKSDYKFKKPYFDLPIAIFEDVNSVGELLSDEQAWRENKKYYLGDIVRNEGEYYILEAGEDHSTFKVGGPLYTIIANAYASGTTGYTFIENVEDMPKTLEETSGNTYILVNTLADPIDFSYVQVYYKGEYNVTKKVTEFDDLGHTHWRKIVPQDMGETSGDTEIVVSSKLNVFRSVRKTYDNNNNELSFNVVENGGEKQVALIYSLGYTNYSLKDNGAVVDYLKKVEFLKNLTDEEPVTFEYNDSGDSKNIIIDGLLNDYHYVRFTYYSDCEVFQSGDTQEVLTDTTGVEYSETRTIEPVTVEVEYDSSATTEFTYFAVSETSEEARNVNTSKACAAIRYNTGKVDSVPLHLFSNSKLFGSTFVENANKEVNITRGSYGAFERHNILGEVNSMDDLKNYRNNYFKL